MVASSVTGTCAYRARGLRLHKNPRNYNGINETPVNTQIFSGNSCPASLILGSAARAWLKRFLPQASRRLRALAVERRYS